MRCVAGVVALGLLLSACGAKPTAPITADQLDGQAILEADSRPDVWLSHGRTYSEQRFSPLKAIDQKNVSQLGLGWIAELDSSRGMEATPIVVDGVMYVTSAWSIVYALDAKTGARKWAFDPGVDKARGQKACCDVVNRGVAVWKGKVYVGAIDGRLIALNARTGEKAWETVTVDQTKPYTITGAPRVVKDMVIIGNGGAELGVRGYVSAYDASTGKMVWRFYTTPNPEKKPDNAASDAVFAEKANGTWDDAGEWTTSGGGGTAWDAIVYDPELNLLYIGVGNGTPWNQRMRSPSGGDNLFLSSIVALKADTGEYAWHFQTTPGESWDYTATQPIILADLKVGVETKKVLMQAPKNGFFYVLDRKTGAFISGDKFAGDLTWASGLDDKGRPIETQNARYEQPQFAIPGPLGAHNWHPMAFSPETSLVYIPAHTIPNLYADKEGFEYRPGFWNTGVDFGAQATDREANQAAANAAAKGQLIAWDPIARKPKWTVDYPTPWNGGVLATAGGLVFQGSLDGKFRAYNAASGEKLWEGDTQYPALSGPISYAIDGEQYIAVTAGWGTALPLIVGGATRPASAERGRVMVFKIGGKTALPPYETFPADPVPATDDFGSVAMVERGRELFAENCMVCHGTAAVSGGIIMDLRWSAAGATKESWKQVVLDGQFSSAGMASFAGAISPQDAESIRAYVVARAHEDVAAMKAAPAK